MKREYSITMASSSSPGWWWKHLWPFRSSSATAAEATTTPLRHQQHRFSQTRSETFSKTNNYHYVYVQVTLWTAIKLVWVGAILCVIVMMCIDSNIQTLYRVRARWAMQEQRQHQHQQQQQHSSINSSDVSAAATAITAAIDDASINNGGGGGSDVD